MKVRSGFVSNSSSASYVIKVGRTLKAFINEMKDEYWFNWFDPGSLREELEKDLRSSKDALEAQKESLSESKCPEVSRDMIRWNKERIAQLREYLQALKDADQNDFEAIFWLRMAIERISVVEEKKGPRKTKLRWETSMHNSFDDLHRFLQSMVCYYFFTKRELAWGKVIDPGNNLMYGDPE